MGEGSSSERILDGLQDLEVALLIIGEGGVGVDIVLLVRVLGPVQVSPEMRWGILEEGGDRGWGQGNPRSESVRE